ncbi:putative glycosyltransferase [Bacillus sp. TS-2]|nr:putative glycosyltransferase [Bacillus sp. TS-2]
MKNILVASYDLEIGGVERSLISLLDTMDVNRYKLDLMLYRHQGEFLNFLTPNVQLVEEIPAYTAFRKSIKELLQEKRYLLTFTRLIAKAHCSLIAKWRSYQEPGYYQMQLMWKYAVPFLPTVKKKYDVAISYLWPHDCVAYKVKAKQKIAWIHTDYSQLEINKEQDLKIWKCFDYIIAVSEACKDAFLTIYPQLSKRVIVMENLSASEYIKKMALKDEINEMTKDPRFKLLTVARLSQAKGIDLAIEAMRILKERGNHFVWYVVGYGGDEEHIRYLIKKYRLEEDFILLGKKRILTHI